MKAERISDTRRRIYRLIVDGLGPGVGMSVPSVIKTLNKNGDGPSRKTVYRHVNELAKAGYIRKIRGTRSPALYERSEKAALLDDLDTPSCHPLVTSLNGGGPNVQNCCNPDNNTVFIPTAEAHINGRYIYPVLKIGELYEPFRVRDDTGEISEVTVWDTEPRQLRGVQYYLGTVPLFGGINIQYWEGTSSRSIHIWPTPVQILPGHVHEAEGDLADRAQQVANWLGRYGGWRLGIPRYSSNEGEDKGIHYACNDPAIIANIPEGFRPASDTGYWCDSTPGPLSVETDDVARAEAVVNFAAITRDLKQGQQAIRQDMVAAVDAKSQAILQLRYDMLGREMTVWEALSGLVDLQHHAVDAMVRSEAIRSSIITARASAPEDSAAEAATDTGGMYQ